MQPHPGTYALILRATSRQIVQVGRLGRLAMQPGFYVYVGSALGSGGLKARVGHHLRPVKRLHWHIDYLRRETEWAAVWYAYGSVRQECAWAAAFSSLRGSTIPLRGFGSSDCRCPAHVFFFDRPPSLRIFRSALRNALGDRHVVYAATALPQYTPKAISSTDTDNTCNGLHAAFQAKVETTGEEETNKSLGDEDEEMVVEEEFAASVRCYVGARRVRRIWDLGRSLPDASLRHTGLRLSRSQGRCLMFAEHDAPDIGSCGVFPYNAGRWFFRK